MDSTKEQMCTREGRCCERMLGVDDRYAIGRVEVEGRSWRTVQRMHCQGLGGSQTELFGLGEWKRHTFTSS